MMSSLSPSLIFMRRNALFCGVMVLTVLLVTSGSAMAAEKGFGETQAHLAKNIVYIPKLIEMMGYVISTFFAASGLMKLKDWINDSERNTLNAALFRLIVAALMFSGTFTYVMTVVNTTFFGAESGGGTMSSDVPVKAPQLAPFGKR